MNQQEVRYVIDSMIWMDLRTRYPKDLFGYIWKDLADLVANGLIRAPEEVLVECARGPDGLDSMLTAEFPDLFVPADDAFYKAVANTRIACPKLNDPQSTRNSGDLHVVTLAYLLQATVVSNEKQVKPPKTRQKIPDACAILGLRHLDWLGFLRERKTLLGT